MARTSTFDLCDQILQGRLADLIREWRNEDPKVSFDEISHRLRAKGVTVAGETVRRWTAQHDLEPAA